jgi:hypothetical protein
VSLIIEEPADVSATPAERDLGSHVGRLAKACGVRAFFTDLGEVFETRIDIEQETSQALNCTLQAAMREKLAIRFERRETVRK